MDAGYESLRAKSTALFAAAMPPTLEYSCPYGSVMPMATNTMMTTTSALSSPSRAMSIDAALMHTPSPSYNAAAVLPSSLYLGSATDATATGAAAVLPVEETTAVSSAVPFTTGIVPPQGTSVPTSSYVDFGNAILGGRAGMPAAVEAERALLQREYSLRAEYAKMQAEDIERGRQAAQQQRTEDMAEERRRVIELARAAAEEQARRVEAMQDHLLHKEKELQLWRIAREQEAEEARQRRLIEEDRRRELSHARELLQLQTTAASLRDGAAARRQADAEASQRAETQAELCRTLREGQQRVLQELQETTTRGAAVQLQELQRREAQWAERLAALELSRGSELAAIRLELSREQARGAQGVEQLAQAQSQLAALLSSVEALRDALQESRNEGAAGQRATEQLTRAHKAALERLQEMYEQDKRSTQRQYQDEHDRLVARHAREMQMMQEQHRLQLAAKESTLTTTEKALSQAQQALQEANARLGLAQAAANSTNGGAGGGPPTPQISADELNALRERCRALQQSNSELDEAKQRLTRRLREVEERSETQAKTVAGLQLSLRSTSEQLKAAAEEARRERDELRASQQRLQAQHEDELAAVQRQLRAAEANASTAQDADALQASLRQLQAQRLEEQRRYEAERNALQQRLGEAERAAREGVAEVQRSAQVTQQRLQSAEQRLSERQAELSRLNDELERSRGRHSGELQALREQLRATHESSLSAREATIAQLQADLSQAREELHVLQGQRSGALREHSAREEQLARQLQAREADVQNLRRDLDASQRSLQGSRATQAERLRELEGSNATLMQSLREKEEAVQTLCEKLTRVQAELTATRASVSPPPQPQLPSPLAGVPSYTQPQPSPAAPPSTLLSHVQTLGGGPGTAAMSAPRPSVAPLATPLPIPTPTASQPILNTSTHSSNNATSQHVFSQSGSTEPGTSYISSSNNDTAPSHITTAAAATTTHLGLPVPSPSTQRSVTLAPPPLPATATTTTTSPTTTTVTPTAVQPTVSLTSAIPMPVPFAVPAAGLDKSQHVPLAGSLSIAPPPSASSSLYVSAVSPSASVGNTTTARSLASPPIIPVLSPVALSSGVDERGVSGGGTHNPSPGHYHHHHVSVPRLGVTVSPPPTQQPPPPPRSPSPSLVVPSPTVVTHAANPLGIPVPLPYTATTPTTGVTAPSTTTSPGVSNSVLRPIASASAVPHTVSATLAAPALRTAPVPTPIPVVPPPVPVPGSHSTMSHGSDYIQGNSNTGAAVATQGAPTYGAAPPTPSLAAERTMPAVLPLPTTLPNPSYHTISLGPKAASGDGQSSMSTASVGLSVPLPVPAVPLSAKSPARDTIAPSW